MKNQRLAQWLQEHTDMLGSVDDAADSAFHAALYESIIDMARNDQTEMVDPVLQSAATHAVVVGRNLTNLLGVPQRLRERIWERIGEEIDPEPAFTMLVDVDIIFVHIIRVIIDAYEEATHLTHAAKAAEISRLYTDSERKVMEYAAQVARANRELAKLEQAKTDFISVAAHELKTPLTLIQGYADIIQELNIDEQIDLLARGINRGTERMRSILDDMLDLSAIDMNQLSLVIEPVDLKRTIELAMVQFELTVTERQQALEAVELELLPIIQADPRRLFQVFKQVVNNAIKYTPDGGRITIKGQTVAASQNQAPHVCIVVQDTGVGIAPEDHEKIFEKFYRVGNSDLHSTSQTKFMGAGPGLGLAIARGLVEAHGGSLWAESPGFDMQNCPGSSITIALPIEAEPPPGVQVSRLAQPAAEPKTTKSKKIASTLSHD